MIFPQKIQDGVREEKKKNSDFNFIVEVTTVQRLGRALCVFQTVDVVKSFIEP